MVTKLMPALLLSVCLVAPAMAETAPAAPPATATAPAAPVAPAVTTAPTQPGATAESHREAVALAEAVGVTGQVNTVLHLLHDQMVQILSTGSQKPPAEVAPIVDQVLMPEMQAQAPALTAAFTEIWAADFTAGELRQLRAFYATPLGAKLLRTQPLITRQAIAAGQAWGKQVAQTALTRHADELRRRGLTL